MEHEILNTEETDNSDLGAVIKSLPYAERLKIVFKGEKENVERRRQQGLAMTHKKKQMYEMGFEDAIIWLLGNVL